MSLQVFDELVPILVGKAIGSADGTTLQTLVTAGERGARIDALTAFSSSAAIHLVNVFFNDGASDILLGQYSLAINAGNGTVALGDLLPKVTSAAIPSLNLQRGQVLKFSLAVALGAGEGVIVVAQGGQF